MRADHRPETTVSVSNPAAALEPEIERVRRSERAAFEADDMDAVMVLRAQRKGLEAELVTTERERVEEVPTGRTISKAWAALAPSDRRAWLKQRAIRVVVSRSEWGHVVVSVLRDSEAVWSDMQRSGAVMAPFGSAAVVGAKMP